MIISVVGFFNPDIGTLRRALNNINSLEEISENELCLELGKPGVVNELPEEVNTYTHNKEDLNNGQNA